MTTSVIEASALCRVFASEDGREPVRAVDGVTFAVPPEARLVALIGPDGAGKSTLMQMICGLVGQDSGSLSVLGRTPDPDDVTAQQHATIPSICGQNTISRKKDEKTLKFQRKYVLWDCAAMLVSGLPTRRCVKVRHYIRTFVSISCEKRLSWNHEHRTENRSSQT